MPCRTAPTAPDRRKNAGFTLLELLVVIAILGLLIGLVAPAALRQLGGARVSVARQTIERLASVLDIYQLDTGDYPSADQGIEALVIQPGSVSGWNGPYLQAEGVPRDPWNRPWIYRNPSTRSNHRYDLCSAGPDAATTPDRMICNR